MAYVDTNVILARYFPDDKLHDKATSFIEHNAQRKFASPVSIVELAAAVSRHQRDIRAPKELLHEPQRRRIRAVVEFIIRDCNIIIAAVPASVRMKFAGTTLSVPLEYHNSMRLAHALELKTLDLIHLAYADSLRRWGHEIEAFVTGDSDILKNAEKIQEQLPFEVKEPR
jgi:predicted nucleic acid-binding protein